MQFALAESKVFIRGISQVSCGDAFQSRIKVWNQELPNRKDFSIELN